MLDEDRLRDDEYEKQYYGFSSTELFVDFKDQTSKAVKNALTEMKTALGAAKYDKVLSMQKMAEFYRAYMGSAKIPLEKFKFEARKIFAIPKNVVLDEDQHKVDHYSDEDIIKLKKEVAELEKELLREQVFLARCKHQKEVIERDVKPTYEVVGNSVIKSMKNLHESLGVNENSKKIIDLYEENTRFYFHSESNENENLHLTGIESDFIQTSDDFFK